MIQPVMAVLARLRSACILWYQAPVKYTKSECLHSCSLSTAQVPKQRREGGGGDGRWETRQKCKSRQRWLVTSSLRLAAALRTAVRREASSSQAALMTIQDKSVFSIQLLVHYKQCRGALLVLGIFFSAASPAVLNYMFVVPSVLCGGWAVCGSVIKTA